MNGWTFYTVRKKSIHSHNNIFFYLDIWMICTKKICINKTTDSTDHLQRKQAALIYKSIKHKILKTLKQHW